MKNVTTGLGLCVLGVGIASYPVLDHLVPRADAGAPHEAGAIVAVAAAQVEPTIVWYGTTAPSGAGCCFYKVHLFRAWSDGRVEYKEFIYGWSAECSSPITTCDWRVFSAANQGFNASSDINFDSKVDGADLGQLLTAWGDAPRQDIPPSDCPLNLINP
jgi:hypothetical protein